MVAFPIDAIIGAAGSVIGGLLGDKPKTMSPRKQILSTVKGAREAGIHPLAALGSGASYQTVGGGGGAGSAIGAGLERLAAGLANQKTEAEIQATHADTEARKAQAELFRAQSRSILTNATKAAIGGPSMGDKAKTLTMFGGKIARDPRAFSSAQDVQDDFGDIAENIVGVPSLAWSALRSMDAALPTDKQLYDAFSRWSTRPSYSFRGGRYAH